VTAEELFAMGLGLSKPWIVRSSEIVEGELVIHIDFERGARFDGMPVHDTVERSWRHLNFWQYATYLHARVPRIKDEHGSVRQVEVPWARPGSGFTALFEAIALAMMRDMPVSRVGQHLGVDDMRLWRLLEHSIESARAGADFSNVRRVGVDETASRRGHEYVSTFVDLDAKRVLFSCRGKSAETLKFFKEDLKAHGGEPQKVLTFSCDMSAAFLSGIREHFPKAKVVLDKFHLVKLLSEAVDETRRKETRESQLGKGTRFLWLKNPSSLSSGEISELQRLEQTPAFAFTAEAYRLRLAFQQLFFQPKKHAAKYLDDWLDASLQSAVHAIQRVASTFFKMRENILSWFENRVSNGILEGLNSVLQGAKARARGYANPQHMILISYLLHGKLDLAPMALKNHNPRRLTHTR
jgi:transposase